MRDDLGDRMKTYEGVEAKKCLDTSKPIIARLDGRGFSKFTKGYKKPFDERLTSAMDSVTADLVEMSNADIGYTQSDEITLIWGPKDNPKSQMFFNGRTQKLCSVLAGKCSVGFNRAIDTNFGDDDKQLRDRVLAMQPHFDCRVWEVPDKMEAANTLLWRAQDAHRNGITVFCQQWVSHKQLQGLCQLDMLEAAYENGAPYIYDVCSPEEIFGRYFKRVIRTVSLPTDIRNKIPEGNRPPEGTTFVRASVDNVGSFYFGGVGDAETRVNYIFDKMDMT